MFLVEVLPSHEVSVLSRLLLLFRVLGASRPCLHGSKQATKHCNEQMQMQMQT